VPFLFGRRWVSRNPNRRLKVKKSREVCQLLESSYSRLFAAIRDLKIPPPALRDCSGDFLWSDQEIAAARQALATDRRRKVRA
jgi:hypothetical protein